MSKPKYFTGKIEKGRFQTKKRIKLYLLKITQNNDLKDVMNDKVGKLFKEYALGVQPPKDTDEAIKYLAKIVFDTVEERDMFAKNIQNLAFEYEDIDYPIEVYEYMKGNKKCQN